MGVQIENFYQRVFNIFFGKVKSVVINHNLEILTELTKKLTEIEIEKDRILDELQWKNQAWNKLILVMFDWVWMTDRDGKYSYVSPKAEQIYGYKNGDILGKMPHEFLEGTYREDVIQLEKYLIESHESLFDYETESVDYKGNKIRTITNCVAMFDNKGQYKGHLGVEKLLTPEMDE